jgi:hypothetical protein
MGPGSTIIASTERNSASWSIPSPVGMNAKSITQGSFSGGGVSPDGKWQTGFSGPGNPRRALWLISVGGGEPVELPFPGERGPQRSPILWTPDSTAIIAREGPNDEYWMVPISGDKPTKLNWSLGLRGDGWAKLHPDGNQIVWTVGQAGAEIWALENFLPKQTASR